MDSQPAQPQTPVRQIAGVVIAAAVLLLVFFLGNAYLRASSSPYIQSVFSSQGDRARGQQIFRINCAGCHGFEAGGLVGPSLQGISRRRSSASLVHQVIDGQTPPMPKFQPTPQEMADLLSYIKTL